MPEQEVCISPFVHEADLDSRGHLIHFRIDNVIEKLVLRESYSTESANVDRTAVIVVVVHSVRYSEVRILEPVLAGRVIHLLVEVAQLMVHLLDK